jgi:hypothetical protein
MKHHVRMSDTRGDAMKTKPGKQKNNCFKIYQQKKETITLSSF